MPINPTRPLEDPSWGCPAAWYRTRYIDSFDRYTRRRTDDGGRVPNPRFDSADWQIQDAVLLYEREQERALVHVEQISLDRAAARRKAAAK
jgi:hypothetical protein